MRNNCASAARYCDSPMELVSWCEPPLTSTNIFGTVAASYSLRPSVGLMRLSAEPCTTSSGAPMFFTLSIASKRCVMKGPNGSQPHLKLLATSAIDVKVLSTMVPLSSLTCAARSIPMAPPSEWPKM